MDLSTPPPPRPRLRALGLLALLAAAALAAQAFLARRLASPGGSRDETTREGASRAPGHAAPRPSFEVVEMDAPFAFHVPSRGTRVVISSAIAVPSERLVALIVREYSKEGIGTDDLAGFRCAFEGPGGTNATMAATNATTPIFLYAKELRFARFSNVWACAWPLGARAEDLHRVRVLLPDAQNSSVTPILGAGSFRIARPDHPPRRPSVVMCGAWSRNIAGRRAEDIATHYRHYASLGVTRIVHYAVSDDEEDLRRLTEVLRGLPSETDNGPELRLYVFPEPFAHARALLGGHYYAEYFTQNDCLYRHKGADWILGQFDADEMLVGVRSLPDYLRSLPADVPAIYINRFLPQEGRFSTDPDRGPVLNVSSEGMAIWDKCIYRPREVKSMWTHSPVNPVVPWEVVPELKLLHYRLDREELDRYFRKHKMTWVETRYDGEATTGGDLSRLVHV